jgi:hypothetical protein
MVASRTKHWHKLWHMWIIYGAKMNIDHYYNIDSLKLRLVILFHSWGEEGGENLPSSYQECWFEMLTSSNPY